MEKNKIQLWGVHFSCSLEVENFRGGAESSKGSQSIGPVREPHSQPWDSSWGHLPVPAPPAWPALPLGSSGPTLGTNTTAPQPSPAGSSGSQWHSQEGACPDSSLIQSRAIDRTNSGSYLTHPSSPVFQHSHVSSTRTFCPAFCRRGNPTLPHGLCCPRLEGAAMLKVAQALSG